MTEGFLEWISAEKEKPAPCSDYCYIVACVDLRNGMMAGTVIKWNKEIESWETYKFLDGKITEGNVPVVFDDSDMNAYKLLWWAKQ